ncbi:TniQ family protein [Kordiimonas sp.]|uniref:TniQ family protein n=1 Tax=Kordiimonas sp. TaxID=1970157 RepID=UPI003B51B302
MKTKGIGSPKEGFHPPVKLLTVLQPEVGESFYGFLIRLAQANFYSNVSWIPSLCDGPQFIVNFATMDRLAEAMPPRFGLNAGKLKMTTFRMESVDNHRILDLKENGYLDVAHVELGPTKVCPACLAEFGYAFKAWEYKAVIVCPRHRRHLARKCEKCGSKLSASRPKLFHCQCCDFDIRKTALEPASGVDVRAAQLLLSKMAVPFSDEKNDVKEPWLSINLADLISTLLLLYRFHPSREDQHWTISNTDWAQALRLVAPCLLDWPYGFSDYLVQVHHAREAPSAEFRQGVHAAFGRFYQIVANEDKEGRYRPLKAFMSEYVMSDPQQALATGRGSCLIYQPERRQSQYLTKAEACKMLGVSGDTFNTLFDDEVLRGFRLQIGRQIVYRISRGCVDQLSRDQVSTISCSKIIRGLGLTRRMFGYLVQTGHLEQCDSVWVAHGVTRVTQSSFRRLLGRLSGVAPKVYTDQERLLSLAGAYLFASRLHDFSGQRFLDAVCEGAVKPRYFKQEGAQKYVVGFLSADILRCAGRVWVDSAYANKILRGSQLSVRSDTWRKFVRIKSDPATLRSQYLLEDVIAFCEGLLFTEFRNMGNVCKQQ